jgi:hypothetical protein
MLTPSLPLSRSLDLPVCLTRTPQFSGFALASRVYVAPLPLAPFARFPAARLWLKDESLEDSANLPLHCHPEFPASLDTLKVSVPPAVKLAPCQR